MEKTFVYRIYPNKSQETLIQKTFGCCRYVYNLYLEKRNTAFSENKTPMYFYDCCNDLTTLKKETEWLREPDKWALTNALKDLDRAFVNYFNKRSKHPKFKSKKKSKQSYRTTFTNNNIVYSNRRVKLPKLGWVKARGGYEPQGRIINATIKQESSGRYYVCICCTDIEVQPKPKTQRSIGIDLGIKEYATTSDGTVYDNPKALAKAEKRLTMLHKRLMRETSGGSNWTKTRIQYAKLHEKVRAYRKDYLHKLSTQLIEDNDLIILESLAIQGMAYDSNNSFNIMDASWGQFIAMLEYKAMWYGKSIEKVDRYYASSQICNVCGKQAPIAKDLNKRRWRCPYCKTMLDRDVNAAKNILYEGLKSKQVKS